MTDASKSIMVPPAALVPVAVAGLEEAMHTREHSKNLIDLFSAMACDQAQATLADEPDRPMRDAIKTAWCEAAEIFAGLMKQHGFLPGTVSEVEAEGWANIVRIQRCT